MGSVQGFMERPLISGKISDPSLSVEEMDVSKINGDDDDETLS